MQSNVNSERVAARSGEEQDGTSRNWRRLLHSRPGRWKRVKQAMNRRARREARVEIDDWIGEGVHQ